MIDEVTYQEKIEEALFAALVKMHAAMMTLTANKGKIAPDTYIIMMASMEAIEKRIKFIELQTYRLSGRNGPKFPGSE